MEPAIGRVKPWTAGLPFRFCCLHRRPWRTSVCVRVTPPGARSPRSDLLISPRWFSPGSENGMIRKGICRAGCIEVREKNAAASTADFPRRGDGDQQPDRSTNGGGQGVLSPRSPAGVPARGARRAEFPYVHQPDDRRWDRETQGDREDVRRADDHSEAVYEVVPGAWLQRVLRGEAAPQFGLRAERESAGASATVAG